MGNASETFPRFELMDRENSTAVATETCNIALVRLSALGDVTLLLPIVRTLQKVLPQAKITWITGAGAYQLLEGIKGVEFVVLDKPRNFQDYRAFGRRLKNRKFDIVLAAHANLRANLLYPWIPSKRKIGFDRARAREGQWLFTNEEISFQQRHLMDSFFSLLEAQGITERVLEWGLPISNTETRWAQRRLSRRNGPVLVINPGASKLERMWQPERYIEVIREVQRRWQALVVLTGDQSAAERGLAVFIEHQTNGVTNLVGQTTPKQLAAVIQEANCVLAPDTGPVHIAVAMGTPVVGMYAVAPSWLSGPYQYRELVVDRYDEAVRQILNRDPEQVPWGTRVHDNRAMSLIEVEDVLSSLEKVFEPE